ncbi:dTDP-4-dehydrorhamnose 3,5-epimerase family protein [Streptomyces boncukensis]|uniref:dTDP-4-keto-6-deoxy-D-glucose epimerase n=1 Tax=Streptomyces boncukensis TaxID=2711219 RepID=A0A6G4WSN9_9ACTN|nr:dTDP-4-dehydrorhamnose 3,5-epimerase family protein [Streptomyces boncukensis]NGO67564.1 dTDP-4-keto-6-deoxy-D-glucose epimerase [Streptomyces boncukensis]
MEAEKLEIEGAFAFVPPVFTDHRGLFCSPFQGAEFAAHLGRPLFPVQQVSHNLSARDVLRGIHYTAAPPGMAKYVYCPYGRVLDILVDLRLGSPTFGRWTARTLDAGNCQALYIPVGVGHAFLSRADDSMVVYILSRGYVAEDERAVSPLDPALRLPLPEGTAPIQSDRDRAAPTLAEAERQGLLPRYEDCVEAEALP